MKNKIHIILSGILCCCVLLSSFPVHAQEVATHAECEHNTPPYLVEVEEDGYGWDTSYHWKNYVTLVKCSRCNAVMEVVSRREGSKVKHTKPSPSKPCVVCFH